MGCALHMVLHYYMGRALLYGPYIAEWAAHYLMGCMGRAVLVLSSGALALRLVHSVPLLPPVWRWTLTPERPTSGRLSLVCMCAWPCWPSCWGGHDWNSRRPITYSIAPTRPLYVHSTTCSCMYSADPPSLPDCTHHH